MTISVNARELKIHIEKQQPDTSAIHLSVVGSSRAEGGGGCGPPCGGTEAFTATGGYAGPSGSLCGPQAGSCLAFCGAPPRAQEA